VNDADRPDSQSPPQAPEISDIWWYHTIELPGGIVTAGEYDHRSIVAKVPLPTRLEGLRCLDVGTQDGFWAFEMERRGAKEVVAIDVIDPDGLDWPEPRPVLSDPTRNSVALRKQGFEVARERLGSKVSRRDLSVYDLDPDQVGTFDVAFLGTLLHHLRDPIGALQAVRRVVTGQLIVVAVVSPLKTALFPFTPVAEILEMDSNPFWEIPNAAGFRRQMEMGGWTIERWGRPHLQPTGEGWHDVPLSWGGRNWRTVPRQLLHRRGSPHLSVVARPTVRDGPPW
jgi:tRNA (mo5U34)-methyltransferase